MTTLSPVASLVRRHDRDRYLTALFAPPDRRAALMALYAFNHEVAKTRESVSEPLLGRVRLQWWRESLDAIYGGGPARQHEVVEPLAEAVRAFGLSRAHFERLIDARELDLVAQAPASLATLEAYCEGTSARLVWLALEALGVRDPAASDAGREVGIGYALTGLVRAIPFHARQRRHMIPEDLAKEVGLDLRELFELRPSPALTRAAERLAGAARDHLAASRANRTAVPRAALPALLPARLAETYLDALARAGFDPFDRGLALPPQRQSLRLAWAAVRGRY